MSGMAYFGFWTCAGIYAAIGVIGIFLIGAQPSIAYSSDGYGTIAGMNAGMAARQTALRRQRLAAPKPLDANAGR